MMPNFAALMADPNNADPAAISAAITATMRTAGWVSLVIFLIFLYPSACLSIKRRHDKDNSGLDVWIYFGLTALLLLVQALGLFMTVTDIGGMLIPTPSLPFTILQIVVGIYGHLPARGPRLPQGDDRAEPVWARSARRNGLTQLQGTELAGDDCRGRSRPPSQDPHRLPLRHARDGRRSRCARAQH